MVGEPNQVSRRLRFKGLDCSRARCECIGERVSSGRLLALSVVASEIPSSSRFLFIYIAKGSITFMCRLGRRDHLPNDLFLNAPKVDQRLLDCDLSPE